MQPKLFTRPSTDLLALHLGFLSQKNYTLPHGATRVQPGAHAARLSMERACNTTQRCL